ncbi:MAG TPA: carboxypeptidase-like regulatory domain-containing protein [Planctomycetota bacterium]|nr:carboxypeptidase-like regulatory domain-containing protein [Planctomycetota bacterium]
MTKPHTAALLFTVLCAVLVAALWLSWNSPADPAPRAGTSTPPGAAVAAQAVAPTTGPTAATGEAAERDVVPSAAAATTGSLLVHVVYGDDQAAAADVEVQLTRSGSDELFETPRVHTDAAGAALFEDLPPGRAWAQVERADMGGGERVEIAAGAQAEVTLTLKMGMNASGRVVDAGGDAVADAAIVVSGWGGGTTTTVAHSAADGTFRLRAMPTHCHIGARKAGFRPSSMRQFTAGDGAEVTFTIVLTGEGSALAGIVLDAQGVPVAGAAVRAGSLEQGNHKLPDGATAMAPQSELVRSDAAGRFVFDSVVPGKVPLAVRARGLAPWHEDVEVRAGRREEVTVRLLPGVTLIGTVRDARHEPLARIDVEVGDWRDLGRREVRTAADGTYRIEGLGVERLTVRIADETRGKAQTEIQGAPGETLRWDPIVSPGLQLRGRVVDAKGAPLRSVMIEGSLAQWRPDDHWFGMDNTDSEGRFTLPNCLEGRALTLRVRRVSMFPEKVLESVVPGPDELVIELPDPAWVYIQGTVLDPDGKPLPNVHASPSKRDGNGTPAETVDVQTGAFRYGPYPPGEYELQLQSDGLPAIRLPWRTLAPDEVWDLGTLRFHRGGTALVQLVQSETATLPELRLSLYGADGARAEFVQLADGRGRTPPLVPGTYRLQVSGAGFACRQQPIEIREGAETQVDVRVQAGVPAELEFPPPDGTHAAHVEAVLVDRDGQVVLRTEVWPHAGSTRLQVSLAPGSYTVQATGEGLYGSGTLTIAAPGPGTVVVPLRPR